VQKPYATLLLLLGILWIGACAGCGTIPSPATPHRELAALLEVETVALVRLVDNEGDPDENGHPTMYCSGVWISPRSILTAGHCIEGAGEPDINHLLRSLDPDIATWDPIGQEVLFAQQVDVSNSYWTAKVSGFNKDLDLGLITVNSPGPVNHPWALISTEEISDGDRVEIVGHPMGHTWCYVEGLISSTMPAEPNADGVPMPTLLVQGPVSPGNSGGGAFDTNGNLVGIASYFSKSMGSMSFFVHRDGILRFLRSAHMVLQ
jgi:S1-C subfamily serine protease